MKHANKHDYMAHMTFFQGKKAASGNYPQGSQGIGLRLHKNFKAVILNAFKELKKPMSKGLKASRRRMSHQIDRNY